MQWNSYQPSSLWLALLYLLRISSLYAKVPSTRTYEESSLIKSLPGNINDRRLQNTKTLSTIFWGGAAQSGAMFDLVSKASTAITITGIDVHTASQVQEYVEVWTKEGSWRGYQQKPEYWYMKSCTGIIGPGVNLPTPVPSDHMDYIYVRKGQTIAIYTTLIYPGGYLQYTSIPSKFTGDVVAENNDLKILAGIGKTYSFGSGNFYDRIWNGNIHYLIGRQQRAEPVAVVDCRPSMVPSMAPSYNPSISFQPSKKPTKSPSASPTGRPSAKPSASPTAKPSTKPSARPSAKPSSPPTSAPSPLPTINKSTIPSLIPTKPPSNIPSSFPIDHPFSTPSARPTLTLSLKPSKFPSLKPSLTPSFTPSFHPTLSPSNAKSEVPTRLPSIYYEIRPSHTPTLIPSTEPSVKPTSTPSVAPSVIPTRTPSTTPSKTPSSKPSELPTGSASLANAGMVAAVAAAAGAAASAGAGSAASSAGGVTVDIGVGTGFGDDGGGMSEIMVRGGEGEEFDMGIEGEGEGGEETEVEAEGEDDNDKNKKRNNRNNRSFRNNTNVAIAGTAATSAAVGAAVATKLHNDRLRRDGKLIDDFAEESSMVDAEILEKRRQEKIRKRIMYGEASFDDDSDDNELVEADDFFYNDDDNGSIVSSLSAGSSIIRGSFAMQPQYLSSLPLQTERPKLTRLGSSRTMLGSILDDEEHTTPIGIHPRPMITPPIAVTPVNEASVVPYPDMVGDGESEEEYVSVHANPTDQNYPPSEDNNIDNSSEGERQFIRGTSDRSLLSQYNSHSSDLETRSVTHSYSQELFPITQSVTMMPPPPSASLPLSYGGSIYQQQPYVFDQSLSYSGSPRRELSSASSVKSRSRRYRIRKQSDKMHSSFRNFGTSSRSLLSRRELVSDGDQRYQSASYPMPMQPQMYQPASVPGYIVNGVFVTADQYQYQYQHQYANDYVYDSQSMHEMQRNYVRQEFNDDGSTSQRSSRRNLMRSTRSSPSSLREIFNDDKDNNGNDGYSGYSVSG